MNPVKFILAFLILVTLSSCAASKQQIDSAYDADREYNPADGRWYHKSPLPKARELLYSQDRREEEK